MTSITADYFRNTKIKILSPEHSKQVQEAVFAVGGRWNGGMGTNVGYEDSPYIYISSHITMTRSIDDYLFDSHEYKEITFPPKQEENTMTEEWKPTAGQEVFVELNKFKYKTLFIGWDSDGDGVFEVTEAMKNSVYHAYRDVPLVDCTDMCYFSPIPKTKLIHGVEVPDISFVPEYGCTYCFPKPEDGDFVGMAYANTSSTFSHRVRHNFCYPYTEEGKQAAILHAKAMLGIAK